MKRFFILTLGCAKNEVDSRTISRRLEAAGWQVTDNPDEAELLLVNTCGFISPAKEESINSVLSLGAEKKPGQHLVIAGCLSQRYARELSEEIPEADTIIGTCGPETTVEHILRKGTHVVASSENSVAAQYSTDYGYAFAGPGSAYVKIAEGCSNRCAYCAIPLIRGPYRSRPAAEIVREAEWLTREAKILEINLISQDTALYRDPENPDYRIHHLVRDLSRIEGLQWLRLLYLHPAHINRELIEVLCTNPVTLPYFDIPVQHLADPVLESMNRKTGYREMEELFASIRACDCQPVVRSTVMTGFPGESEDDFETLLERLAKIRFDKLGCFVYSQEEETPAASLPNPVSEAIAAGRMENVMEQQRRISSESLRRFIGSVQEVLVEEKVAGEQGLYIGRSRYDAPDVDGCVVLRAPEERILEPGTIHSVRIKGSTDYDMHGDLI